MKKQLLLSLCLLGASTAALATDYTDTLDELQISFLCDDHGVDWDSYYTDTKLNDTDSAWEWEGDVTGIKYEIAGLTKSDQSGFYCITDGGLTNITNPNGLYLKKVKVNGANSTVMLKLNKDQVVGFNNNAPDSYESGYGSNPVSIEKPFKWFFVNLRDCIERIYFDDGIESVDITWTDEAPVETLHEPYFNVSIDYATQTAKPGTTVYMNENSQDSGTTVKYTVKVNDGAAVEYTGEAGAGTAQYVLNHEVGDQVTIVCWTVKEGAVDSPKATKVIDINLSKLDKPGIENSWNLKFMAGNKGKLYNPNMDYDTEEVIGTMHYNINGTEGTTTEYSVDFTIAGEVGADFTITAWVEAEGYLKSDDFTLTQQIEDAALKAPHFQYNSNTVTSDTEFETVPVELNVYSEDSTYGQYWIKVNDGEWTSYEAGINNVELTAEEGATILAQLRAWTEPVEIWGENCDYTYRTDSPIATITIKKEQLGDEVHVITPHAFFEDGEIANGAFRKDNAKTATIKGVTYKSSCEIYEKNGGVFEHSIHSSYKDYICNVTPIEEGISAIKVNENNNDGVVVYFCDDVIADGCDHVTPFSENVAANGIELANETANTWINLASYDAANGTSLSGKKYMCVVGPTSWSWANTRRILLATGTTSVGVEEVAVETALADGVYTVSGLKVAEENLLPGLYVKVANGKATKVLVK